MKTRCLKFSKMTLFYNGLHDRNIKIQEVFVYYIHVWPPNETKLFCEHKFFNSISTIFLSERKISLTVCSLSFVVQLITTYIKNQIENSAIC